MAVAKTENGLRTGTRIVRCSLRSNVDVGTRWPFAPQAGGILDGKLRGMPSKVDTASSAEKRGIELAKRVLGADWRAVARAITLIENDDAAAAALVTALYPRTGHAHIIGVTGPPGSGKSTLVDVLTAVIRKEGLSVGIVAVDPSSPFTGGAVLGDRVRMQRHAG